MLEARARFQGGIPDVFIRVGRTGGELAYYLDLGDHTGQAVAVDAGGWRLVGRPGVDFWRPEDLLPMPAPLAAARSTCCAGTSTLPKPIFAS